MSRIYYVSIIHLYFPICLHSIFFIKHYPKYCCIRRSNSHYCFMYSNEKLSLSTTPKLYHTPNSTSILYPFFLPYSLYYFYCSNRCKNPITYGRMSPHISPRQKQLRSKPQLFQKNELSYARF